MPETGPSDEAASKWIDPQYGRFGGILEGRIGDRTELQDAARRLREVSPSPVHLDLDGPRFSVMLDDRPVERARLGDATVWDLSRALQDVVDAAEDPAAVESTLHAVLTDGEQTVEVLFAVSNGVVRAAGRRRPARPEDLPPRATRASWTGDRRRVAIAVLAVAALLIAIGAPAYSWLARTRAARLQTGGGPFDGLVAIEVEDRFPGYLVRATRGPDFPATPEAADGLASRARDLVEAAAIRAVRAGGSVRIAVLDERGRILAWSPISLAPLLSEQTVVATLPADPDAARVSLMLP